MEALLMAFGAIALLALVVIYESFSYGFLLYKFWYWFVLPAFPNLPHITFYHAVGLCFIIGLFKSKDFSEKVINGVKIESKPNYVLMVIAPWITLLLGWFVSLFI